MFSRLRRTAPRPHQRRRTARLRLHAEALEARCMLAAVPFGATPTDTGEYMLGDVQVSVVFIESSAISPNTETWTPAQINDMKANISSGLQWWEDVLQRYYPGSYLDFKLNFTHADTPFVVDYEPIQGTSFQTASFVNSFLASKGYTAGSPDDRIYAFNHNERVTNATDWAFTLFVVNAQNDSDGMFAAGGFSRSFAYPGGRYLVTLSNRPAEVVAHETAHIFWGLDEYNVGGDAHSVKRGYYNAQNLNGSNSAPQGFVQQPSIMVTGDTLTASYVNMTLPEATRAHIGWRDSDGDKIIDVVDVAHTLSGTGRIDPATGNYRFVGKSQVRTLPNLNSAGNRNDITINRIHLAEYSFDNGATWQTAATYDAHSVELDLTIPLAGESQILIRTRDTRTGVSSDLFTAPTNLPTSLSPAGISGFVYRDIDADGTWDSGEGALANRTVRLVDATGTPVAGPVLLDPSDYPKDSRVSHAISQATLSVIGDSPSGYVGAFDATFGSYTSRVFGAADSIPTQWSPEKRLKVSFNTPVRQVSIDFIGSLTSRAAYGRLELYDSNNVLIGRITSGPLALGQVQTLTVSSASNIAYAVASGHMSSYVALDRLVIGAPVSTTTNVMGAYALPYLAAGTYRVQAVVPADWEATAPTSSIVQVTVATGTATAQATFGQDLTSNSWHNTVNSFDVDGDNVVTPLDALLVINNLNTNGARRLEVPPSGESPPAFIDTDGDGYLTPLDALGVIIRLNQGASGEAPLAFAGAEGDRAVGVDSPPQGESLLEESVAPVATAASSVSTAQAYDEALLQLGDASSGDQHYPFSSDDGSLVTGVTFTLAAATEDFPLLSLTANNESDVPCYGRQATRSKRSVAKNLFDPPPGGER